MKKFSQEKLENVAENSLYTTFTNSMTIEYSFEIFNRFLKPGSILELGPAEGLMTNYLKDIDHNIFFVLVYRPPKFIFESAIISSDKDFSDLLNDWYLYNKYLLIVYLYSVCK